MTITPKRVRILKYLMDNEGNVVTQRDLKHIDSQGNISKTLSSLAAGGWVKLHGKPLQRKYEIPKQVRKVVDILIEII